MAPSSEPAGYSDAELEAAIERLSDPERFRAAETLVARAAPRLQGILAQALHEGGWFAESHDEQVRKALAIPDEGERATAISTLLAEEARMGMLVGVALGWALRDELLKDPED